MTILKIDDIYIRSDMINYYSYDKEEDETNISCNGVWISPKGDWTGRITSELKMAEKAKVITLGGLSCSDVKKNDMNTF